MEEHADLPFVKRVLIKLRGEVKSYSNANETRIRRRRKMVSLISHRLPFIQLALLFMGYSWMLALPISQLGRSTYIDENALQPHQVNTYWNWDNVHAADIYHEQLERLRDVNASSEQRAHHIMTEFDKLGLSASVQNYAFLSSTGKSQGTNSYAVLAAPRGPGSEAMVISASWLSRSDEGDGTLNLRGVATVLALADFLKRYSLWAKDIVFVISDGYLDGMHAWLSAYHEQVQSDHQIDGLKYSSGVIWTALNIDYPGHSFSHLGIFFEGLNGRLPNQDLLNSFERISRRTGGVPVTIYDHIDPKENSAPQRQDSFLNWLPPKIRDLPQVKSYFYHARNIARHVGYQALGQPSGVHGLFHQFRIDAITVFAVPAIGPHGFHAMGRIVESTLRTMNNLLERLHASFFFYILTGPIWFIKIGNYLPSAVLISVAMMFQGLRTWVDSAWILDNLESKEKLQNKKWTRRQRDVIKPLGLMITTHFSGFLLFAFMTKSWFFEYFQVSLIIIGALLAAVPFLLHGFITTRTNIRVSPVHMVLKALNLCLASAVISVTTVLNFSLAASLAVFLGIPLSISGSSASSVIRTLKYCAYICLAFGWLLVGQEGLKKMVWNWEILSIWFSPFICIIYVPLVLQAALICLTDPL